MFLWAELCMIHYDTELWWTTHATGDLSSTFLGLSDVDRPTVSEKKLPPEVFWHYFPNDWDPLTEILSPYAKLLNCIHLSLTFTKSCHINGDHPANFYINFSRKRRKIAISLQQYAWSPQNLAWWRRTGLSNLISVSGGRHLGFLKLNF